MTIGVPHQPRSAIILLQESGYLCTRVNLIFQVESLSITVRPTGIVGPYAAGVLLEIQKLPHENIIVVLKRRRLRITSGFKVLSFGLDLKY
jgi:hypothetical protein